MAMGMNLLSLHLCFCDKPLASVFSCRLNSALHVTCKHLLTFRHKDFLGSDYVVINKETGFAQAAVTEKTTPIPSTSSTILNEALNRRGKQT